MPYSCPLSRNSLESVETSGMSLRTVRSPTFKHRPTRLHTVCAWLAAGLICIFSTSVGAAPAQPKGPRVTRAAPAPQGPGTDLDRWCKGIATLEPAGSAERCLSLQLSEGDGRSVKGIPLWSTDIEPPADSPTPLRVLVLGGIHADEAASVILVLDWIVRARQGGTAQPVHWRMAPLVNPDGFFVPSRKRVNFRGVDLNRNFATHQWREQAHQYWIKATRRDPRRFPGPTALSEPESQWVHQQIGSFQPQLIVSVHAPYGVLDFDGPPPPPTRLGNLMLDQVGIYPGSLGNYGGIVLGVPVVTIELRHSTRVPTADAAAMWNDLQRWIGNKLLSPGSAARLDEAKPGPRVMN
jgi:murein peptide amidase A